MKNRPVLALGDSEIGVLASIVEVLKLHKWPDDNPLPDPLLPTLLVRCGAPPETPPAHGLNYWEARFLRSIRREPRTGSSSVVTQCTIMVRATTWQGSNEDENRPESLVQLTASETKQVGNGTESLCPVWSWNWSESLLNRISPLASLLRADPAGEIVVCQQRNWSHLFLTIDPFFIRRLLPTSPDPDLVVRRVRFTNIETYLQEWKFLARLVEVASGLARAPMDRDAAIEQALALTTKN